MSVWMVERELHGIMMQVLAAAQGAAQSAAINEAGKSMAQGTPVRHRRSVFSPTDGRCCCCLFEAASADAVRQVNDAAGLPLTGRRGARPAAAGLTDWPAVRSTGSDPPEIGRPSGTDILSHSIFELVELRQTVAEVDALSSPGKLRLPPMPTYANRAGVDCPQRGMGCRPHRRLEGLQWFGQPTFARTGLAAGLRR